MTPRRVREARRKLRVLALVHEALVPPDDADKRKAARADWKTEYDVVHALRALGHEVQVLGIGGDLGPLRQAIADWKPQIAFNLVEAFDDVSIWDANVVAYLELMKVPYTGCSSPRRCCRTTGCRSPTSRCSRATASCGGRAGCAIR